MAKWVARFQHGYTGGGVSVCWPHARRLGGNWVFTFNEKGRCDFCDYGAEWDPVYHGGGRKRGEGKRLARRAGVARAQREYEEAMTDAYYDQLERDRRRRS